ncbi:MAG: cytochrome ubiquinol oxidase subunit I, partial [Fibromonadales bacterium]|nr:cytochrome ubiquinol oxidase subunit I [Fibromonadales bacterium]
QFPHVIAAAICTAAFFVLGISAWKIRSGSEYADLFKRSFDLALILGFCGLVAAMASGHLQGQSVAKLQPMKLAAMENLRETANPAPLSIVPGIEIPAMLSLMVHNKVSCEVKGINELQKQMEQRYGPGNYTPPIWIPYISFRLMVGASLLMLFLLFYGIIWHLLLKKNMHKKMLILLVFGMCLPYLANTAGWLIAEVGRQPWVVYGIMPTEKAVSLGVSKGGVIFSIVAYTIIYSTLAVMMVLFMRAEVLHGQIEKKITRKNKAATL